MVLFAFVSWLGRPIAPNLEVWVFEGLAGLLLLVLRVVKQEETDSLDGQVVQVREREHRPRRASRPGPSLLLIASIPDRLTALVGTQRYRQLRPRRFGPVPAPLVRVST